MEVEDVELEVLEVLVDEVVVFGEVELEVVEEGEEVVELLLVLGQPSANHELYAAASAASHSELMQFVALELAQACAREVMWYLE